MPLIACILKIAEEPSPQFTYIETSQVSMHYFRALRKLALGKLLGVGRKEVISKQLLQLYLTLTFISHNSCPQETHPLRNRIKSSWTISKSASYQLPGEATQSNEESKPFRQWVADGSPPWGLWIWLFLSLNPKRGGCDRKWRGENTSALWNQTPFWNLGWALQSGSHPLAYLQAPASIRWLPPLRSFCSSCSSGHTDREQPGAWVPQSARAKRFSRLVTKWEKEQRRTTRTAIKIQFLGTRGVPAGSDSSYSLSPSSFSWQRVTQEPESRASSSFSSALPDRSNLRCLCHTARPAIHSLNAEEAWLR